MGTVNELYILDNEGRYVFVDSRQLRSGGFDPVAFLGEKFSAVLPKSLLKDFAPAFASAIRGESAAYVTSWRSERPHLISVIPCPTGERILVFARALTPGQLNQINVETFDHHHDGKRCQKKLMLIP
jgi:hypothetical protein